MSLNSIPPLDLITNNFASTLSIEQITHHNNQKQLNKVRTHKPHKKFLYDLKFRILERGLATKTVDNNITLNKRTYMCGMPIRKNIQIDKSSNGTKVKGLIFCGNIWQCPVCRYIKLIKRRNEIKELNKQLINKGINIYFITLTPRHHKGDSLQYLLGSSKNKKGLLGSAAKLNEHKNLKKVFKKYNLIGSYKAIDITWSKKNGWHPHLHLLIYTEEPIGNNDINTLELSLGELWSNLLQSSGLDPTDNRYAVNIKPGENAVDYLIKCGTEKDYAKLPKGDNYSIFNLEYFLVHPEQSPLEINLIEALLRDYYGTFFGKNLLTSSGIKKLKDYLVDNTSVETKHSNEVTMSILIDRMTWMEIKFNRYESEVINAFELLPFNKFLLFIKNVLKLNTSGISLVGGSGFKVSSE